MTNTANDTSPLLSRTDYLHLAIEAMETAEADYKDAPTDAKFDCLYWQGRARNLMLLASLLPDPERLKDYQRGMIQEGLRAGVLSRTPVTSVLLHAADAALRYFETDAEGVHPEKIVADLRTAIAISMVSQAPAAEPAEPTRAEYDTLLSTLYRSISDLKRLPSWGALHERCDTLMTLITTFPVTLPASPEGSRE